jgi:hypothetical protein
MVATRRLLATIPHQTRSVAVVLLAVERIGAIASTAFLPITALLPAAKWWINTAWGARAKALSLVIASALCASPAWSAGAAAKDNRAPAGYPAPRCNDPVVYERIAAEYRSRHWASGFAAVGIRATEASWQSWPQHLIPRRFCQGTIQALSGAERPIYYAIIADGLSYELQWCVVGLDRAWPYDPRCRLARP